MEDRINDAVRDLERSLKGISSLIEWEKLQLSEQRPYCPPSFQFYDSTAAEIRIEVGFFLKTIFEIRCVLEDIPRPIREKVQRRLFNLQARLDKLLAMQPEAF